MKPTPSSYNMFAPFSPRRPPSPRSPIAGPVEGPIQGPVEGPIEGPVEGRVEGPSSEPKGHSLPTYKRGAGQMELRSPINREAITKEAALEGFPRAPSNVVSSISYMHVILYSTSPPSPPYDFFDHHRSLSKRQRVSLSPYLFTLVMEVLSLLINKKIEESDNFKFHWRFSKVKLTHLCFADDPMIFSHGDPGYVDVIKSALEDFSRCSGLKPNLEKSLVFFGNVPVHSKAAILEILPFPVSTLPIKTRMSNWKNKTFSFTGRLQLIKSVVSSLQVYWSSVFILPKFVSNEIEKLMRGFLWTHDDSVKGKAKTVWTDLSTPKPVVPWFKIVWFSQNIHGHSFILWLAINKRLNTQDRVAVWNKVDELKCPLCSSVMDDHNHLFFSNCKWLFAYVENMILLDVMKVCYCFGIMAIFNGGGSWSGNVLAGKKMMEDG
ncbi:RNA-directed DNA polymerase, eukaryota, reverse transcriptase zinc-binding domain protein [Tanacetum coccineum]|uniref:RNA-directed DNA polymerase, eukaryota, reverse transcriptase zinc-binding domain protein n=1 Tax=Tanacetum coccineum TaxID=301880 RepID=A0ABQ4WNY0_9ASTR